MTKIMTMNEIIRPLFLRSSLVLALIPVLSACPGSSNEEGEDDVSNTETGETSESEESADESSESADESSESVGETSEETSEPGDSTDSTDESTDGGTEETGEPDPDTVEACMAGCAVFAQCGGQLPGCVEECVGEVSGLDAECILAANEFFNCIGELTCEEFQQLEEGEPEPYPCQEEETIYSECAGGGDCLATIGQGENPGECSVSIECPDEPEYAAECNGDTCICLMDGVEVGSCENAQSVCDEPGSEALVACCGFPL